MSDDTDDRGYSVGYGRPPLKHRFTKGKSGNDKGRPIKKFANLSEMIGQELDRKRVIEIDNRRETVTTTEILIKKLFVLAMKGDKKALLWSLEMAETHMKAKVTVRDAQSRRRFPSKEEMSKMTQQQLTDLYMETLKEVKGGD